MEKKLNPLSPYLWAKNEATKGVSEILGAKAHNPRIIWYHGHTTLKATDDETPWCSAFLCAAAESCGFPSTRSAAAKSWIDPKWKFLEVGDGAVGDIAIFSRAGGNHVAFISSPYKEGDKNVIVLGGNQKNMVCESKYPADRLIGIRRFKV